MSDSTDESATTSTKGLLDELQPIVGEIAKATIGEVGIFGCALRASVAKSYEFTSLVFQEQPPVQGFFITATLRGICEDLIAFTFLEGLEPEQRNKALSLLMRLNLAESVRAQSEFFADMRPWQPVVQPSKNNSDFEKELRALSAKLGWKGRQAWPSVWHMAKAASLEPLYTYLYSATSKWVHFSPQVLLRMGWGGDTLNELGDHTKWTFTTANFTKYYVYFNQTYALMLFLQLLRGPASPLFPDSAQRIVSALQLQLDEPLRWPEAVTFEELNLQGPKEVMRVLYRSMHDVMVGAAD